MAKKTVNALIDMVNYIIDHPVRQNIEFTTTVEDAPWWAMNAQIAGAFIEHVCHEVQVKKNPEYDWAAAYIHKDRPEFTRVELIIVVL